MKLNISEIKNKCEKDDKVTFSGQVKIVFPVTVLSEEKITKYAKARQNVIIKDDTGEIKVIITFKELGNDYSKSIEGKDIEVSGKVSIYNNEKNIFGYLKFKEGEAPQSSESTVTAEKPKRVSTIPIVIEVRKASLKMALDFWTARIGDKMEEGKIIKTADIFYLYLTGKADKATVQKKETVREEEAAEVKKEGEDIKKEEEVSAKKIELINSIMKLKEEHHIDAEVFKSYCNGKEVKALTIEELEKVKKILNEMTEEIPF